MLQSSLLPPTILSHNNKRSQPFLTKRSIPIVLLIFKPHNTPYSTFFSETNRRKNKFIPYLCNSFLKCRCDTEMYLPKQRNGTNQQAEFY